MSMTRRPSSACIASEGLYEAAVVRTAERVVPVQAREHVARLLGPRERVGRVDTASQLHIATLVQPVLGPRARIVLHARDLDDRHVARLREATHARAMRVAGEVARDRRAPL